MEHESIPKEWRTICCRAPVARYTYGPICRVPQIVIRYSCLQCKRSAPCIFFPVAAGVAPAWEYIAVDFADHTAPDEWTELLELMAR